MVKNNPFPEINIRSKKKLFRITKILTLSLAILGIIFLFLVAAIINSLSNNINISKKTPKQFTLQIDLDKEINETTKTDVFSKITDEENSVTFYNVIKSINDAKDDKRVKALIANINDTSLGLAQIEELKEAIEYFASSGKKTYIYSPSFGNYGNGLNEYYLATSFNEIWLQPNAEVGITGINIEVPFFNESLNKIGISPSFSTRYEFKTAVSSLTDKNFTKSNKEQMKKLAVSIYDTITDEISNKRNISKNQLNKLINNAPIFANSALENKLVDKIGFKTDLLKEIYKQTNSSQILDINTYTKENIQKSRKYRTQIALITGSGVIKQGSSEDSLIGKEKIIMSDDIIRALKDAAENKNTKAIVIRLDSPGGSYSASNEIWGTIKDIKEKTKLPIIISQGNYAASGGYFISIASDMIITNPLTITGSIGVLSGKMVLNDLWNKLGVNWGKVKIGKNASILSSNSDFSVSEKLKFEQSLDNIYQDFTNKVSDARNINIKQLDKLARGRVWMGYQAEGNGLADKIGGISKAINIAKEKAGIKNNKFSVVQYPKEKTFIEVIKSTIKNGPISVENNIIKNTKLDSFVNMFERLNYSLILPIHKIEL